MIRKTAMKLNDLSSGYKIGSLQDIRKEIKHFERRPGTAIFTDATIAKNDEWAFHHGGRKELQFNIGLEDEGFRFGVALSLEESQTVPDISILYPKAKRLNQFIRQHPDFFADYKMWHWHDGTRSTIYTVKEIGKDLLKKHTFIFIGKIQPENNINYEKILETFDELLKPYIFVEKSSESLIVEYELEDDAKFTFNSKARKLPKHRDYSSVERTVNLTVRHSLIQEALIRKLQAEYGDNNVSYENPIGGKAIDVVVKNGNEFIFYEVKASGSAKACIRDAVGQLLEYAYWPGCENANVLVVVGEEAIDEKTSGYLKYLRDKFSMPLQYKQVPID